MIFATDPKAVDAVKKEDARLLKEGNFCCQHTIGHILANAPGMKKEIVGKVLNEFPQLPIHEKDAEKIRKKYPMLASSLNETESQGTYTVASKYTKHVHEYIRY